MKIRVVLTVEMPDGEAKMLKAQRALDDTQLRDFMRDEIVSVVRLNSDWLKDLEADITLGS